MKINVLRAIVLLLVVSSCSTSKTAYFENLDIEEMSGKMEVGNYELRIAPDDMLSITVSSVVPDAAAPYNLPAVSYSEPGKQELTIVPNLQVYTVDKNGYIYFPIVGRIRVEGMTRNELSKFIEDKIRPELKDPFVLVQFMNFKVVVLGEVKNPGQNIGTNRTYVDTRCHRCGRRFDYLWRTEKCIVDAGRKWQTDFPSFRFDRSISIWIALFLFETERCRLRYAE